MNEIKCPKCGEKFKIDEAGYADILKQVRDSEFAKEIRARMDIMEQAKDNAVKLAEEKQKNSFKDVVAERDLEISQLKAKIDSAATEKDLAIAKAVGELKIDLANKETEIQLIKSNHDVQLRDRDDAIERLKDMKTKLSTKMIGESLEQYCQNEFNKIRTAAFPNAYFEKDNDASSGSKGDFIFRDLSDDVEIISIMFEMKNENEDTGIKQKNEKFFAELDKDRREKGCEYAILVSMLEADNDFYNQGIVDVSFRYPKMYVIRPQFFIPMITLLKNAAAKTVAVKKELETIKGQNIDITTFEEDLQNWKKDFMVTGKNFRNRHNEAIKQIDKAIKDLQTAREALTTSNSHLDAAENKLDKLTIKHLTRNSPTMRAKFDEQKS